MFHQSREVFRPKEVVNPLGELRKTGIVFSTEAHTVIMDAIVSIKPSFAKRNRPERRLVRCRAGILITFLLTIPAMSVELFRYRGAAKDGGTLEYVFEAGEQDSPNAVTKKKRLRSPPIL